MNKEAPLETVNVLQQDIYEQAYLQVENMIRKICWEFQHKYGGEYEEWLSEAHFLFMQSILNHDYKRSQFITWLWNKIRWGFLDIVRQKAKRKNIQYVSIEQTAIEETTYENILPCNRKKSIIEIIEEASDPVIELWHIIHYTPPELEGEINPDDPYFSWDAIERYCKNQLRWTWKQMHNTMIELEEICSE